MTRLDFGTYVKNMADERKQTALRVADEQRFAEERAHAAQAARLAVGEAIAWSQVPRHHLAQFWALNANQARSRVSQNDFTILVLYGAVGSGKTMAAAEWVWNDAKPRGGMFLTMTQFQFMSPYDEHKMRRITTCCRLVLDDVGTEYSDKSGAFTSKFETVLNARYCEKLPTILTTNLTCDEFCRRYGPRVARRVHETGGFFDCGIGNNGSKEGSK